VADRPRASARRPAATTRAATARAATPGAAATRAAAGPVLALPNLRVAVPSIAWFKLLGDRVRLAAGKPAPEPLRVPAEAANRVLRASVRLVADVPARGAGTLVWTQGDSELQVDLDGVRLACATGLVTVSVPVACDQLPKGATVAVPLAVGSAARTAGLVMSTFDRLAGPALVTAVWSEALTAFAWEALVHLAQQLSGGVGKDAAGRALVPSSIGAEAGVLLVHPMARHDLGRATA
jgi:hypothetical protein